MATIDGVIAALNELCVSNRDRAKVRNAVRRLEKVKARSNGELYFQDNGHRSGSCNLLCHGEDHDGEDY